MYFKLVTNWIELRCSERPKEDHLWETRPNPGRAPGNPYGRSTTAQDFRPRNSPAKIIQTEPGDFGYFGKHLIKSPGNKKVPGRIAGRPDPAKNRPYGRSPSGTVRQPF